MIGFVSQIPSFIITPFAGYLADHYSKIKLLKYSQFISFIQAFTLATTIISQHANITVILCFSFFLGSIESFEAPIRHSLVSSLAPDKSLIGNAIAINASIFNGARFIGPAIAGFLISSLGEGYCFLINAFCYIVVLSALFKVNIPYTKFVDKSNNPLKNIYQGLVYIYQNKTILFFIINVAIFTTFGFSYIVLLPAIARDILSGNAKTLGYIMTMIGLGALTGAIILGSRKNTIGITQFIVNAGFIACAALAILAISKNFYTTAVLAYVCGLTLMIQNAGANILIQTLVIDSMRGRVLSIYSMAFLGFTPIGSLIAGTISTHIGVTKTMLFSVSILFIACLLLRKKKLSTL